jgi:hypothetical protein
MLQYISLASSRVDQLQVFVAASISPMDGLNVAP